MRRQRTECRYHGRIAGGDGFSSPIPDAQSFIDGAILLAETLAMPAGDVSIVVTDRETTIRRCFRIELGSGAVVAG